MSIEIVSIGNEVLRGMIVNTNAAYLGRRLDEEGWSVIRQTTLPDDDQDIQKGLQEALDRSKIVITTGGLGPTIDDITAESAQKLFTVSSIPLHNRMGSAPGVYFQEGDRHLFLLPGIPAEMEVMFEEQVLTKLPPQKKVDRLQLNFAMLNEKDVDPILREMNVDAGIYPAYGSLKVVLRGTGLAPIEKKLKEKFAAHYFDAPTLEEAIQKWMITHGKTLVTAESCTGGMIAASLVKIPDASKYFLGSFVTYSNEMKEKVLHVSSLKKSGAVSGETVHEMWKGALDVSGADFAVAVSGVAGPTGGTPEKPVGSVYYAIGFKGQEPSIGNEHSKGPRSFVIMRTTRRLLGRILNFLKNGR